MYGTPQELFGRLSLEMMRARSSALPTKPPTFRSLLGCGVG